MKSSSQLWRISVLGSQSLYGNLKFIDGLLFLTIYLLGQKSMKFLMN